MIRSRATGDTYIGGTKRCFVDRFSSHLKLLRAGRHEILPLQALYDAGGPEDIEFLIVKPFPIEEVHRREREAINRLEPTLNPRQHPNEPDVDIHALAKVSGIDPSTIRARVRKGLRGDDLVKPPYAAPRKAYERRV